MKRNFKFCLLNDNEFQEFADNHPEHNFFQTLMMKNLLLKQGREVYLIGVREDNKLIAASLIASSSTFLHYKTFEALKGFLLDYNDFHLLYFFTQEALKFIKTKKGFRLIIDPYIPFIQRDSEADIIKGKIDNRNVLEFLKQMGYKEVKNNVQVKWTYVLDIAGKSPDELLKSFKPNTRNYINRTIKKYQLLVEEIDDQHLDSFKKITEETAQRRGFPDRSIEYYQDMLKFFKNQIKVLICKLDCNLYSANLTKEKENLIKKLQDSQNKKENIQKEISKIKEKIKEVQKLKKEEGKVIPLAAAMFMLYGDEIVYLFSGSNDKYMKYCGQYLLQWEMIKYASLHNYKRYNFYGIKDVFNKNGKDYGVYEFKKGFNGYVEELLGAFELGTNKTYTIYQLLKKIKTLIKK